MKSLIQTTALVAALATPAFAASDSTGTPFEATIDAQQYEMRASNLIGMRLYTSENETTDAEIMDVSDDWTDVGNINDIVIGKNGTTEAVLLDIGGFLGLGERTVAVTMDKLKFVRDGDDDGDFFIVVKATQADLEQAPEIDMTLLDAWTRDPGAEIYQRSVTTGMATMPQPLETADVETPADTMETDMVAMENRIELVGGEINSDALTGAMIFDANNDWIGEVSEFMITDDGKIQEVILDVGGFLGIGEHHVAIAMDEIKLMRDQDNASDITVHVNVAGETLKDMPEWTPNEG